MSLTVQLCSETHFEVLSAFFQREPYYGLFFRGNLAAVGLAHPDLQFWGGYENGQLVAVLMRYLQNWLPLAGDEPRDLTPLVQIIDAHPVARVHGKPWIVDQVVSKLERQQLPLQNHDIFCALAPQDFTPGPAAGVRKATLADAEAIGELYAGGEMAHTTAEVFRKRLGDLGNRCYVLEQDGRLVSAAMTTTETAIAAMIGGVYTPAAERGRGYASRVMSALCAELLAEGKEPCLFYDNPAAGAIYRRLGFHDIGFYQMAAPAHS